MKLRIVALATLAAATVSCNDDRPLVTAPLRRVAAASASATLWSDPASWPSGIVPQAGESVIVPAGANIRLDVSPPLAVSVSTAL